jgi:hypothetical protein
LQNIFVFFLPGTTVYILAHITLNVYYFIYIADITSHMLYKPVKKLILPSQQNTKMPIKVGVLNGILMHDHVAAP